MLLLAPLLALLLVPLSLAASVEQDHAQLIQLAKANNGVIPLNEASFTALTNSKRTWSASIQFTAMDKRRRCTPCKEFEPAWIAVGSAWNTVSPKDRDTHFFGTLDFENAQAVFQRLGIMSAPVVNVYPAVEGPRKPASGKTEPFKYDFSNGFDPAPLAEQLSSHTPVPIPYRTPINWARWVSFGAMTLVSLLSIRFVLPVLKGRLVWILLTVIPSIIFTGGFMFTQIRGSPWEMPDGQWMAPGYSNQYGKEVQMISIIYGGLASCFLALILITPYVSPARQRAQVYVIVAVIVFIFSALLSIFRFKNRGYPFKILFS